MVTAVYIGDWWFRSFTVAQSITLIVSRVCVCVCVCVCLTTSRDINALFRETEKWNCLYKFSDSVAIVMLLSLESNVLKIPGKILWWWNKEGWMCRKCGFHAYGISVAVVTAKCQSVTGTRRLLYINREFREIVWIWIGFCWLGLGNRDGLLFTR
jgi:hypothetical protein